MLHMNEIAQSLYQFSPLHTVLFQPEERMLQVRNGLPEIEPPMDQTVYIVTYDQLKVFTNLPSSSSVILYVILDSPDEQKDGGKIPYWVENYILFPAATSRSELYYLLRKLFQKSRRIENAYFCLSRCLLERKNLDQIMAVAEELLENPLFLSDTSTRVLSFSNPNSLRNVQDELIRCVLKHGFVLPEYFEKYDYANLLDMIEKTEKAFYLKSEYEEKKDRIIVKITVNRRYFGWIVLYPLHGEFQDGDCEIMDILANVLSLELERNKIGFSLSCRENLLMELLSGHVSSLEEFQKRARGFDWEPQNDFYIMAISFHDGSNSEKERTITAYKNHLGLIYPTYKSICIENTLLLLLETPALEAVISTLENFLASYHLSAGCSRHFTNILDFKKYYEQAINILRLGRKMHPEERIYRFDDYYLYYLLIQYSQTHCLQHYCIPEIKTLFQYDKENNSDYVETLQAYLHCRNIAAAAGALHIHRNTMNYRIQKIEEITGLNLMEGEDLYHLWFSLLIQKMEG